MIYSQQNDTHGKITHSLTWMYAHGELETFLGFDNIDTDTLKIAEAHKSLQSGSHGTYVFDDFAMNEDGEIIKIKLYMWDAGTPRGLAVSVHDKEGISHALDRFERLSPML
jgi:hypothetical protein